MRAAQRADCGVERVLIVDWDVHHGNGTQDIFYDDPSVLTFSIHRRDRSFYPPSGFPEELGQGSGEGFNINVGWSQKGMGDGDYVLAFARVLLPVVSLAFVQPCFDPQLSWQPPALGLAALNIVWCTSQAYQFNPDLIIISAGFDACAGDPLGGCNLTPAGFAHLTAMLRGVSRGKVVMVQEGGYNIRQITRGFAACLRVLRGESPPPLQEEDRFPKDSAYDDIRRTERVLSAYWMGFGYSGVNPDWDSEEEDGHSTGSSSSSDEGESAEEGGGDGTSSSEDGECPSRRQPAQNSQLVQLTRLPWARRERERLRVRGVVVGGGVIFVVGVLGLWRRRSGHRHQHQRRQALADPKGAEQEDDEGHRAAPTVPLRGRGVGEGEVLQRGEGGEAAQGRHPLRLSARGAGPRVLLQVGALLSWSSTATAHNFFLHRARRI